MQSPDVWRLQTVKESHQNLEEEEEEEVESTASELQRRAKKRNLFGHHRTMESW